MNTSTFKVLLAEDGLIEQHFMKQALSEFDVQFTSSYSQTIKLLAEENFDILVSDYYLKDGVGVDFLGQVNIPVIFVTGCTDPKIVAEAMKKGAKAYITKDMNGDYLKLLPTKLKSILIESDII